MKKIFWEYWIKPWAPVFLFLLFPLTSYSQLHIGNFTVEEDKMLHYIGGVAITSIAHDLIFEETKDKDKAVMYSMATTLALATFKEIFIDRKGDGNDITASMYGALTVGFTIELDKLLRKKKK